MNNKAMLIGAIDAGKSTLTNALLGRREAAVKTQTLNYQDWIVDTPGEYTENPMFYKNIMATSLEVTHIMYLQDATSEKVIFPPGFSTGISKLPIGVITKYDHEKADVERAVGVLKTVLQEGPVVITSALTGKGLNHLQELVKMNDLPSMRKYVENHPASCLRYLS